MVVLRILWSVVKALLFVGEALLETLDSGGRAASKQAASWGRADEPPTRDRNSFYYGGPGNRP